MNHHRVQRVFNFVRDAGRDAAEVREFLREVPLGFEFLERLIITEADQGADGLARVLDVLHGCEELSLSIALGHVQGRARYGPPLAEGALDEVDQRVGVSKALVNRQAGQLYVYQSEYLLGIGACQDYAAFPVDQQQPLFEMADDLSKPASHQFQFGPLARESLPELPEAGRDSRYHVLSRKVFRPGGRGSAAEAEAVDARRDRLQRPEQQV